MDLLNESKRIKGPLDLTFTVSGGWCLIAISARVKSEKQRGEKETNDEDLAVKIDNKTFPHPSSESRLIDSPAAFSGGQLHNKLKTIYFITYLTSGDHQITLDPQYGSEVEEVSYEDIEIKDSKINLPLEKQAETANGRPWITFVLDHLSLTSITAKVTVKWHFPDGDDVKLIVDGKIKRNPRSILHKNWIWASSILHKISGGETREDTFAEDLPHRLHYVEFHADESPTLHYVSFSFGETPLPRAKIVVDGANLREQATTDSINLHNFKENDVVEVLEKVIEGEAPYKERGDLTNIWHKIRFGEIEGYIFSETLEIGGEDKETIKQLIIEKAKEISADPQIAVALSWCESNLFPYKVSEDKAKGLFQLSPDLITDPNNENRPFYSPVSDPFDIKENTSGGLSYLKWLYKLYKDDPQQLEKTIVAYNSGPGSISEGHMDIGLYEPQTQRLVSCVKSYDQTA